jgi:hypothetical protein
MQLTDLLIVHSFLSSYLSFLCFEACLFQWLWKPAKWMRQNDPPNKCAKITRQNILPWQPAGFIRENNPPNLLARKICHFNSRLACQRSPLPCSKSPARQPSPPHSSANGAGSRPGPPTHLNRYFCFHSPFHEWLHILIWHDTYMFYTERIEMKA